jgi:uncharacterized protein (TIGR03382 family)
MINRIAIMTVLAAGSSFAAADIVASYSFTDLNGSYDAASQAFTAFAQNDGDLSSGGDVSLLTGSKGTAQYDTGFLGLGSANVEVQFEVFNITPESADSGGIVSVTDADGDTLTAFVSGSWNILNPFGFMFFNGTTTDFEFTDNGDQDGSFDGVNGSFSLAGLTDRLFDGAVSIILQNPGGFSAGDFEGVSTQTDGILIPTPGVLAIAGLGLAGMARRRK